MTAIPTKPVPGTRDVYPEDMALRRWLFGHMHAVAAAFGFVEYDACLLEHEILYVRKAGDEITGQLFNFEDKGGRRVALRPEMTPSLARMVMAKQGALAQPLRWYAIPQCFRYERQQRGRKREHFQWNMDVVGLDSAVAEAELMAAQALLLERLGFAADEVEFRVNDRRVLEAFFADLGVTGERFAAACVIIDKLDKIGPEATGEQLRALAIEEAGVARILAVMELTGLDELAAAVGADNPGVQALTQLRELAAAAGFAGQLRIDPAVVRGLSYYTGTVWELFATTGSLRRAIAGGGRYDRLLETLGGKPTPMVGFGFGDVAVLDCLAELERLPSLSPSLDAVVFPMDAEQQPLALGIASGLRRAGLSVAVDATGRRFKHVVARAEADGAGHLVVLGAREVAEGSAVVRRLDGSRHEERVALARLESGFLSAG